MKIVKHISMAMVILGLSFMVGCGLLPTPAPIPTFVPPATATPVPGASTLYTVGLGTIQEVVKGRGRITAVNEAFLFFKLQGWIKSLNINPGDVVEAGALLAELDAPDLEDRIAELEKELAEAELWLETVRAEPVEEELLFAKADLRKAEIALEQAQARYDEIAWKGGAEATWQAQNLEQATINYEVAQTALTKAEAEKEVHERRVLVYEQRVASAKDRLDRAWERFEETFLYAPFSGVIISVDKRVGEKVDPYEAFSAIADPSQLQLKATVPESEMPWIGVGQTALVTLDLYPQEEFSGTVKEIATEPTIWQGKNVYEVTIDFDDPSKVPATIRMGADVAIVTKASTDVILVPTQAIYSEGDIEYVEVVEGDRVSRVQVQTGLSNETQTEILRGLKVGQTIRIRE